MKKSSRIGNSEQDALSTAELNTYVFGAGDVEAILGIESWRLQKFLSGKRYQLSPTGGQIGKNRQGSRRVFRIQDVYRIGIANFLVRDGFSANFVSRVLQFLEDSDLISFGAEGRERPPSIGFVRGPEGPNFVYLPHMQPVPSTGKDVPYYLLDLPRIVREIDLRVREETKS